MKALQKIKSLYPYWEKAYPTLKNIAAAYGTLQLAKNTLKGLMLLKKLRKSNLNKYGRPYVVITGGSDGLGKALAHSFAKRGFPLILISRDMQKLDAAKQELLGYNVEILALPCNLTDIQAVDGLAEQLADLDIGILVNNAGVLDVGPIQTMTVKQITNNANLNMIAPAILVSKLISKLESRDKRSAIINISSLGADFSRAGLSIYSASKSYLSNFTKCVALETKNTDLLNVMPGPIDTAMIRAGFKPKFFESLEAKLYVSTPQEVAEVIISKIGVETNICGTFKHGLRYYTFQNAMPFYTRFIKQTN